MLLLKDIEGAAAVGTDDRGTDDRGRWWQEPPVGNAGRLSGNLSNDQIVGSLEHVRFGLTAHRSVPPVILPTKRAAEEGDEEVWRGDTESIEVTPCFGYARNVNGRIWIMM